jgi:hypothetical protein
LFNEIVTVCSSSTVQLLKLESAGAPESGSVFLKPPNTVCQ